jgi:cobalamin biosynthesis Co2+ chelatase CbiK
MSVYYSIIYVITNSALQERIAIGLILTDGITVLSKFSDYKINIIANFFDTRGQQLFKDEVQALKKGLSKDNKDYAHQQAFAAKAHLQKLSIYNNNLWTVSAPSDILIELNEDSLQRLFSTYISKMETAEKALPEVQTNSTNA